MRTLEDDLKAYYRSRRVSADPAVKAAVADGVARECAEFAQSGMLRLMGCPYPLPKRSDADKWPIMLRSLQDRRVSWASVHGCFEAAVVALVVFVSWADPSGTMGLLPALQVRLLPCAA